ncbi:MAG: cytochrome c oxidase subunit I [Burkholderiaceae bacterium]
MSRMQAPGRDAGREENQREAARQLQAAWAVPRGSRYWTEVNNTQIGIWYAVVAFFFFLFAGVLALLMRAQLAVPGNELLDAGTYNQLMTMHGSAMMFLFAVPILEAFAIILLPDMLGARDLPFPRLSAFGFWSFLFGGVFVAGSVLFDAGPQAGWFMYPPLTSDTSQSGIGVDIWLLGLTFIEVASIAAAIELITGVLKSRAPGMRLDLMPPYAWYLLVVGAMILLAFPPLIIGDLMLEMHRAFDWPFFDAARGGDPLLWQHLFWVFGHPEVYIIFLPAVAILTMVVPTFARTPLVGYPWVVLAAISTGFLSFGLWVHHMFATGLPSLSLGLVSAASEAVAIPAAIQVFALIGTVLVGRTIRSVPMLFAAGALAIFVLGGLTGVMVAVAPFNWQAHDTYFIVAHLHYVLFGGMVFPLFAGLYYYYPKITSRIMSERAGRVAFWLMFAGFNIAFLPMHLTGMAGMPRRVFTYSTDLGLDGLNLVSTIGAFVLAAGIGLVVLDALRCLRRGRDAGANPWRAGTLEWMAAMPGASKLMRCVPVIEGRYPLWEQPGLERAVARGDYYLADAPQGLRETLVTTVVDAEPLQCLRVPGPTSLTIFAAAAFAATFIFATFHWVWAAGAAAVATLCVLLVWLWTGTGRIPEEPMRDVGMGLSLPVYVSGPASIGWWAMLITMIADQSAFLALVFSEFFYWTVATPAAPAPASGPLLAGLLAGALAWVLVIASRHLTGRDRPSPARIALLAGALLAVGCAVLLVVSLRTAGLDPSSSASAAMAATFVLWCSAHLAIGIVMLLFCLVASLRGRLDAKHDGDIRIVLLYWHFLAFTLLVSGLVLAARGAS